MFRILAGSLVIFLLILDIALVYATRDFTVDENENENQ